MERVYLLLRNNQQTGPFTIDELLQQQVKPSDMIWVEGKSSAWTYLSELELTPHIVKVGVVHRRPMKNEDEIEAKAEELRQRILASAPKSHLPSYPTEIESYASPYKLSENQIEFVDIKKERRIKKNTALIEFLLTFFVAGLFMLGIYKGKSFLGVKDKVHNSVATELDSRDQHAAQKTKVLSRSTIASVDTTSQHADSLLALQKAKQKPVVKKMVVDSSITQSQPVINTVKTEEKVDTNQSKSEEDDTTKQNALVKKEINPPVSEVKTNDEPVKEEKKGFLKGLFKKKKKDGHD